MMKPPKINKRTKNEKTSLGSVESTGNKEDQLRVQAVINLENENFEKLINPKRLIQPTSNVKKTNLKKLFLSMTKNGNNDGVNTREDKYISKPFERFNNFVSRIFLPTQLPNIQLIESLEPFDIVNTKSNDIEFKTITSKKVTCDDASIPI